MTTAEISLICGAITAAGAIVGGIIRLGSKSLITSIDDAKGIVSDAKIALNRNTDATLEFVRMASRLESKLDRTHDAAQRTADGVEHIADEISGVHRAAEPVFEAFETRTPAGGYAFHRRPGTKGDR